MKISFQCVCFGVLILNPNTVQNETYSHPIISPDSPHDKWVLVTTTWRVLRLGRGTAFNMEVSCEYIE